MVQWCEQTSKHSEREETAASEQQYFRFYFAGVLSVSMTTVILQKCVSLLDNLCGFQLCLFQIHPQSSVSYVKLKLGYISPLSKSPSKIPYGQGEKSKHGILVSPFRGLLCLILPTLCLTIEHLVYWEHLHFSEASTFLFVSTLLQRLSLMLMLLVIYLVFWLMPLNFLKLSSALSIADIVAT